MSTTTTLRTLTAKDEAFCQGIFKGLTQYEAYRQSHHSKTTRRNTIDTCASLLMDKPKIIQRIAELRNAVASPLIADLIEREADATSIMRDKEASRRDRLAANRLIGEYQKDLGPGSIQPSGPVTNITYIEVVREGRPEQRVIDVERSDASK